MGQQPADIAVLNNMASRQPNRIAELRDAQHLSVRDLAQKLHWDHNKLHRIETGATKLDVDTMRRIAAVLGVKASALLNDDDVELRADPRSAEVIKLLADIPVQQHVGFLQMARDMLHFVQGMAVQVTPDALAGSPKQVGALTDLWRSFGSDSERENALSMWRLMQRGE